MTLVVAFGRGFDARHPMGEALYYAIDVDQQEGFWVSARVEPDTWLGEFMGEDAIEADFNRILPGFDEDILIRKTALPEFDPAKLELTSERVTDAGREIGFHLQSPAAAEYVQLLFSSDAGISAASVNGFQVKVPDALPEDGAEQADVSKERDRTKAGAWWRWRWYGLPEEGADVTLTLESGEPLEIKIIEVDYGTPEGAPPRPENSMPRKYSWSDSLVIFQVVVLD